MIKILFIYFLIFGFTLAHAENLTLKAALDRAHEVSPDIQQLRAQVDSAVQKSYLAIAPAEPTFSITDNDMVKSLNLGTAASKVLQVTQPLGFPGRAFLARSSLLDQADAIRFQVRAMELQVSLNVKTAYFNLQLAQRNIQLNADTRLAYQRIMEIAKRRYEAGATGQVDFLNAQVALLSNENDLQDLQTTEKASRTQLNTLMMVPMSQQYTIDPIKMIYYPPVDLNNAAEKMMSNRNELNAARSSYSSAKKAYRLAWMSLLPDFQFTLGTTEYRERIASPYSGLGDDQGFPTRTYSASVSFTLPMWFFANERAAISGASADKAAAQRGIDIVYNQSKVALESAVDTIHSTEAKVTQFEKHILPLSDQSFKLALTDYSSGRVDFQTLADTAASRRQVRLNYASAVVAYLINYATYLQLTGED